jgi:hypothetical protein
MSLATSLAVPANLGFRAVRGLLHANSLQSMARAVGVVVGAGMLAASYQIAHDEGQTFVQGLRDSARQRRSRNSALMLALVGTALPLRLLKRMRRSRDVFCECMAMVTDPALPDEHRAIIRAELSRVVGDLQQE